LGILGEMEMEISEAETTESLPVVSGMIPIRSFVSWL
jgi:hypothetical protein